MENVLFYLAIVLSALLQYTAYDYSFGILKLFLVVYFITVIARIKGR